MIKILLLRLWPIWIPLLLYLVWLFLAAKRAKKTGEPRPRLKDGPWLTTLLAMLGMTILMLIWLGFSGEPVDGTYVPAQLIDGELVPGHIVPRESSGP